MSEKRLLLRHALATLAYRTTRALENAPMDFANFNGAERRPVQILAHMGDLMEWALSLARGEATWNSSHPLSWQQEQKRFFASLEALDDFLASKAPLYAPVDRLFQGPIADALTHTGQLAMLRRLSGSPTRGEDFYAAGIQTGQVGPIQPTPAKFL
jgi:hypothetical protein